MKKYLTLLLTLLTISVWAQKSPTEAAAPIVAEGKRLYRSEMASWYGTDIFLEKYSNRSHIGGYFSYTENDTARCVFFSKTEHPRVIGTISFDSTYDVNTATLDLTEREFTAAEYDLYQIRKIALETLQGNKDDFFSFYKNTTPNLIPLIQGKEKKVYILTGTSKSGVVIFGNDYLLTFNKNNKLVKKVRLHQNIISTEYGKTKEGMEVTGGVHTHLPETGQFITATDICTLMLYEKLAHWKTYNVISEKYLNIWNCETDQLTVITTEALKRIEKDQEERKRKKDE